MSDEVLTFDHVYKEYSAGPRGEGLRGRLARIGRRGPRQEPVRALQDVSFSVAAGESVGIIGVNGAGKSTTLKLATKVTYPTKGSISVRGRVGALLEVGSGMHPDLTGRENVFLYGAILGLSRAQLAQRLEAIVEFAGIGRALDQPVRQFSSGMMMRLGFAIAIHIDPDIFLVDEAIAVGDTGFQHRCVERMKELISEGRTLVFVSHDMVAVEAICERVLLLDGGVVVDDGPASGVVERYLARFESEQEFEPIELKGSDLLSLQAVEVLNSHDRPTTTVDYLEPLTVRIRYRAREPIRRPHFTIAISDGRFGFFTMASMLESGAGPESISGEGEMDCRFESLPLSAQNYEIWGEVRGASGYGTIVEWQRLARFRVEAGQRSGATGPAAAAIQAAAPLILPHTWVNRAL